MSLSILCLTSLFITCIHKISFGSFTVAQGGTQGRRIRSLCAEEGTDRSVLDPGPQDPDSGGTGGRPHPRRTEPLEWHSVQRGGDGLT